MEYLNLKILDYFLKIELKLLKSFLTVQLWVNLSEQTKRTNKLNRNNTMNMKNLINVIGSIFTILILMVFFAIPIQSRADEKSDRLKQESLKAEIEAAKLNRTNVNKQLGTTGNNVKETTSLNQQRAAQERLIQAKERELSEAKRKSTK